MTALLLILLGTVLIVLGALIVVVAAERQAADEAEDRLAEARVDLDAALTELAAERQARQVSHREQRRLHAALASAQAEVRVLRRQLTADASLNPATCTCLPSWEQALDEIRAAQTAADFETPGETR